MASVGVHVVHPYSRIYTDTAWKKPPFILSNRSDLHMINNRLIVVHAWKYAAIICIRLLINRLISLVSRVFANGPGNLGSIPGRVIPKTLKMVLDTSLLNTQQYKVRIKGKVELSRERSSALPYTSL